MIAGFYVNLHNIHQQRDTLLLSLKKQPGSDEKMQLQTEEIKTQAEKKTDQNHSQFVADLKSELAPEQVDRVKDGLTYGVLPITYKAYQDMIPNLTPEQKVRILEWLTEARENAMDGGTSEEKHAWFGKYKGRINNYLSSQGYDLKKLTEEWEKRIREK
jgi:hypothetical protein